VHKSGDAKSFIAILKAGQAKGKRFTDTLSVAA
jgi:hypothetical protein